MRITIDTGGVVPFAVIEVNPSTLEAVDEIGTPVVLFPQPGERDQTTLRQLLEEAMRDDAYRAPTFSVSLRTSRRFGARMIEVICDHDDCGGIVRCVSDDEQARTIAKSHRDRHNAEEVTA